MKNEATNQLVFLTLITGRKQKDALLNMLTESGGCLISTLYGKGSVKANYIKNVLGLIPEENKVVITCLLNDAKADAILEVLVKKFKFDKPNTGIAFTVPVNQLSF